MKRKLALGMAMVLTAGSIAACGGSQPAATTAAPAATTAAAAESTAAAETAAAAAEETTAAAAATAAGEREGVVTDGNGWYLWDENGQIDRDNREATGENGVVAANKVEASQAGVEIIKKGGNAVDAAIAVCFALGVVEPNSSGIGGGGFMNIHTADGENHFINYREKAPAAATPDMWQKDAEGKVIGNQKAYGGKAIGVPGTVKGMEYAFEHYGSGKVTWEEIIEPAVKLADEGFIVGPQLANIMKECYGDMVKYPEFGDIYLNDMDLNYEQGEHFENKDLAKTLKMIQKDGSKAIYEGPVADKMVETVQKYGGLLTLEDLKNYEVQVLEPVTGTYRGYTIVSSPLPSSGGTHVIEALNIMENFDMSSYEFDSPERMQLMTEVFRRIFHDREDFMGDPAFVDVPQSGILSKERAKLLADQIKVGGVSEYEQISPWQYEHEDTTNFAVADKDGNMVCVTQTINWDFGSHVAIGGYGFLMNDEMDDFSADPESPNAIAGGKIPLSSMSPSFVLDADGKPFMTTGTPGSVRIITCVTQIISNVIDYNMGIEEAIKAPRVHALATGKVYYEPRYSQETIDKMTEMGYEMEARDETDGEGYDHWLGGATGAQYGADGTLTGVSDMRRDGKAVGY